MLIVLELPGRTQKFFSFDTKNLTTSNGIQDSLFTAYPTKKVKRAVIIDCLQADRKLGLFKVKYILNSFKDIEEFSRKYLDYLI